MVWAGDVGAAPLGPVTTDPREAVGHRWLSPAEALRAHAEGRLDLLPPTWVTLHDLVDVPSAAVRKASPSTGRARGTAC
ncbi:hypothetical protein [Streptomyces sp. NPDC055681]